MDLFKMKTIEINQPSVMKKRNDIISICQGIMMSPPIYPLHLKVEAVQQISPEPHTSVALMVTIEKLSD